MQPRIVWGWALPTAYCMSLIPPFTGFCLAFSMLLPTALLLSLNSARLFVHACSSVGTRSNSQTRLLKNCASFLSGYILSVDVLAASAAFLLLLNKKFYIMATD